MAIDLPGEVRFIIHALEANGFEAYAVGGCVRDSLMGKTPRDWDICTPALPEQILACFGGRRVIKTGIKHGTVTLMLEDQPFEITTYRVDGKYTDNRRPDSVKFVNVLKRDLARRDFTANAMAYNLKTGLVDYYGGQQDTANGIIKCVGNPGKRFREDALRIFRALRFASALGFSIDGDTAAAMHENRERLRSVSAERISAELSKLLLGDRSGELLLDYFSVVAEAIPELGRHALAALNGAPKDLPIRLALLFNDAETAKQALSRLRYDGGTAHAAAQLVQYKDAGIPPERKHVRRWLNKLGEERLRQWAAMKRADAIPPLIDEIIERRLCFTLKDLAANGTDLLGAGIPEGTQIGAILNRLLDKVMDEEIENDKAALMKAARTM